jgi:hypothetical protein
MPPSSRCAKIAAGDLSSLVFILIANIKTKPSIKAAQGVE